MESFVSFSRMGRQRRRQRMKNIEEAKALFSIKS